MADKDRLGVIRGTLDLLILRTLARSRAMHGVEILESIHGVTNQNVRIEEGALYPALHRMERRGWLASTWDVSPKGRRAKYYSLTDEGIAAAEAERERWTRYVAAVAKLVGDA